MKDDSIPDIRSDIDADSPATWSHPRHMEPLLPTMDRSWSQAASALIQEATRLDTALPKATQRALAPLLRLVNCYHSNLIEGHRTLPSEVATAMRAARSGTKPQQTLVAEALAHVHVQEELDRQLDAAAFIPTDAEALSWMHHAFISRLPEPLRWTDARSDGSREAIIPGAWRQGAVIVGDHVPPSAATIPDFLTAFADTYRTHAQATPESIAGLAAAHQRLLWIHPFVDGNGRVARLMTDAMFARLGLAAGGLWRISRGFARRNSDYKALLRAADREREGSLDGRGNLSQRGLDSWCAFVVEVAHDQIIFMRQLLAPETLPERIIAWAKTAFPASSAVRIGLLLERAVRYGSVDRPTAYALLAVTERHARRIIDRLVRAELIILNDTGELAPGFPLHVVPAWFPDLFPRSEDGGMAATAAL